LNALPRFSARNLASVMMRRPVGPVVGSGAGFGFAFFFDFEAGSGAESGLRFALVVPPALLLLLRLLFLWVEPFPPPSAAIAEGAELAAADVENSEMEDPALTKTLFCARLCLE